MVPKEHTAVNSSPNLSGFGLPVTSPSAAPRACQSVRGRHSIMIRCDAWRLAAGRSTPARSGPGSVAPGELAEPVAMRDEHAVHPLPVGVARAVAYIQARWRGDFTTADLAEAARVSPFHLIRTFHQHVGVPPAAYRRELRVRAAQRLLEAGWPPAQAAIECGFYDQAHLNRNFKAFTGLTPSTAGSTGCSPRLPGRRISTHR
jgi:AraC-like DNA-binding protein